MSAEVQVTGQRRRIAWLAAVLGVAGIVLLVRMAGWQLFPHPELTEQVGGALLSRITAMRGSILDANGQYLVASSVRYQLEVSPNMLDDKQAKKYAPLLSEVLSLSPKAAIAETRMYEILMRTDPDTVPLGEDLPAEVGLAFEGLVSSGTIEPDAFTYRLAGSRVYPDDKLAAHVLGWLRLETYDAASKDAEGFYGLEEYYDQLLHGVNGSWQGIGNSSGKPVLATLSGYTPAHDGADLVLNLDRNIQFEAERLLQAGMEANKAASGSLIVVDSRTGGVLAMANAPSYLPEFYGVGTAPDRFWVNASVSLIYEPGSVFKALTLAAALDARVIRPTDTYDDRGELTIGGRTILNADKRAHGVTTMTELLAHSYNVGAAHVAVLLGPTRFYEAMRRFGIGEKTGIDLAHEIPGLMLVPNDANWSMSYLGANSYGQGISPTPLQMVMAYAALANNGVLMRPYVVSEIHDGDTVKVIAPVAVRHAISAEAAQEITRMLVDAVKIGMPKAVVPGYALAGKSGTASMPAADGYGEDVVVSFIGYGPAPDARFVILVEYVKPQDGSWGAEVAAPTFREMAQFLLDYYGIPPTEPVS